MNGPTAAGVKRRSADSKARVAARRAGLRVAAPAATLRVGIVLALVASLVACSADPPPGPEAQLLQLVDEAERAAEARDADPLQRFIADDYSDAEGRDAQAIRALIGFRLLRHGRVHLLTRVEEIVLGEPGNATVSLFAAMAGGPLASLEDLASAQASLYRFDFTLRKPEPDIADGRFDSWRVVSARFRRARIDDFR